MTSFKALAAAALLAATAATPAFAHAPGGRRRRSVSGSHEYRDFGYNPKNDFNPNGTMRAAIQEPGAFAFYYPNLDVLNGGEPTPAAKASARLALQGGRLRRPRGITGRLERHVHGVVLQADARVIVRSRDRDGVHCDRGTAGGPHGELRRLRSVARGRTSSALGPHDRIVQTGYHESFLR